MGSSRVQLLGFSIRLSPILIVEREVRLSRCTLLSDKNHKAHLVIMLCEVCIACTIIFKAIQSMSRTNCSLLEMELKMLTVVLDYISLRSSLMENNPLLMRTTKMQEMDRRSSKVL